MYNQQTKGMATTRHMSLIERCGRKAFVRDKGLAHTQRRKSEKGKTFQETPIFKKPTKKDSST